MDRLIGWFQIQRCASEYEMSDAEYSQLALQQWNRLYSSCVQYAQRENAPLACVPDHSTGMVAVVKQVPATPTFAPVYGTPASVNPSIGPLYGLGEAGCSCVWGFSRCTVPLLDWATARAWSGETGVRYMPKTRQNIARD